MKEEALLAGFKKGLEILNEEFLPYIQSVPLYGPILYTFVGTLVNTFGTFMENSFDDVYKVQIGELFYPVGSATDYRLAQFFKQYPQLTSSFADELAANDSDALRRAYPTLYKILVLEDIIVRTAYAEEISEGRWKDIVEDSLTTDNKVIKFVNQYNESMREGKFDEVFANYKNFISQFADELSDDLKNDGEFKNALLSLVRELLGVRNYEI